MQGPMDAPSKGEPILANVAFDMAVLVQVLCGGLRADLAWLFIGSGKATGVVFNAGIPAVCLLTIA